MARALSAVPVPKAPAVLVALLASLHVLLVRATAALLARIHMLLMGAASRRFLLAAGLGLAAESCLHRLQPAVAISLNL
jgi:hypothetical protein